MYPEEGQKRKSTLFMPKAGKNKYEMVIVASREARRINEHARITGEPVTAKVTGQALRRALDDDVPFQYEEPALPVAEEELPAEEEAEA